MSSFLGRLRNDRQSWFVFFFKTRHSKKDASITIWGDKPYSNIAGNLLRIFKPVTGNHTTPSVHFLTIT